MVLGGGGAFPDERGSPVRWSYAKGGVRVASGGRSSAACEDRVLILIWPTLGALFP